MTIPSRGGLWASGECTRPGPPAWRHWMADISAADSATEPPWESLEVRRRILLLGITTLLGISEVPFLMPKAAVMKVSTIRALPVLARTLRTFNIPPRLQQVPPPAATTIGGHLVLLRIPFLIGETSPSFRPYR